MVDYRDLRSAQPHLWSAAADDWKRLGGEIEDAALELRIAVLLAVSEWWRDSSAADAATAKINAAVGDLQQLGSEVAAVSGALSALALAITRGQQLLAQADQYAAAHGLQIYPDGSIAPANAPTTNWPGGKQQAGTAPLRGMIDQAVADATAADTALRALTLVPADTPRGAGAFYINDTGIQIPPQEAEDDRPQGAVGWWDIFRQQTDEHTLNELYAVQYGLRDMEGYTLAASLLGHWLSGAGTAVPIDPRTMMSEITGFRRDVQTQINNAMAAAGSFDSGWLTGAVEDYIDKGLDTGPKARDWFYALNHYQYRVHGTVTLVGGHKTATVTVDLFKRYNYGNPVGGKHRDDLSYHGLGDLPQNQVAQLNADGLAKDFNVWGSATYQVTE